jgi:hypothetical protein
VYANPDDLEELQFITLRRYARVRPRLLRSIASAIVMRPHRIGQSARFIGTLSLACRRGARYRAFPISMVRRVASEALAETEGFEPSIELYNPITV